MFQEDVLCTRIYTFNANTGNQLQLSPFSDRVTSPSLLQTLIPDSEMTSNTFLLFVELCKKHQQSHYLLYQYILRKRKKNKPTCTYIKKKTMYIDKTM